VSQFLLLFCNYCTCTHHLFCCVLLTATRHVWIMRISFIFSTDLSSLWRFHRVTSSTSLSLPGRGAARAHVTLTFERLSQALSDSWLKSIMIDSVAESIPFATWCMVPLAIWQARYVGRTYDYNIVFIGLNLVTLRFEFYNSDFHILKQMKITKSEPGSRFPTLWSPSLKFDMTS